ncbi:tail fiber assembly protein [Yersinia alsatica]|uniref:tail fiber assembly protein n=1 Tax=Yersinia alsatica TaxID=2890317 RepID=UPI0032EDA66B
MSIQFDKDGYATSAGTVTVHNVMPDTREYIGSNDEFINMGQGIPAHAYLDVPPKSKEGFVICRMADKLSWEHVPDRRGEVRYSTITGNKFIVSTIGDYLINSTDTAPLTEFDKWEESQWVTDTVTQHTANVNIATDKKAELIAEATIVIAPLADAKNDGYIEESDIPILSAWQRYRYALTKVDVSKAPEIDWPAVPE